MAIDVNGYTPALACAPSAPVADCLSMIVHIMIDSLQNGRRSGSLNLSLLNLGNKILQLLPHYSSAQEMKSCIVYNGDLPLFIYCRIRYWSSIFVLQGAIVSIFQEWKTLRRKIAVLSIVGVPGPNFHLKCQAIRSVNGAPACRKPPFIVCFDVVFIISHYEIACYLTGMSPVDFGSLTTVD